MKRWAVVGVLFVSLGVSVFGESSTWRRLVRGDVVLYCHENDLRNGERIVAIVEQCGPRILDDLELAQPDSLTLFLAGSKKEFQNLTDGAMPEWSAGAADPQRSVLYLQSPRFADPNIRLEEVVAHELSHAILGMAVRGAPVDCWFEEGFAMLESGESGFDGTVQLMRGFVFGEALGLLEIEDVLRFNRDKAGLAYQESLAAVKYLVERFGPAAVPDLVSALRAGKSMAAAMQSATGIPYERFQSEWLDAMRRKYRTAVALDFSLLLSVVFVTLFAAAWVSTRIRTAKKKMEWEKRAEQDVENDETHPPSG